MDSPEQAEIHWQLFRSQPAAFAHPDRIARAFDGLIDPEIAMRLGNEERFRDRLSALLAETYALSDDCGDAPSTSCQKVALASETQLEDLVRQAGAIYWARAIAGEIESGVVTALKEAIGEGAYAAAIAHHDLAASEAELPTSEQLNEAITTAGLHCLEAWCARQPRGLAQRIRLKLPDSFELDEAAIPPFDEAGPRIVDRLIG